MRFGKPKKSFGNHARGAFTVLCISLALARNGMGQETANAAVLHSAFAGLLQDDAVQDDVELTSLLAPTEPTKGTLPPDELPPPESAKAAEEDPMQSILKRLEALEKANKGGESKKEDAAKGTGDKPPIGEWVDMSNDKWNVRLGGQFNLDYITWPDHDPQVPAENYIEFRRIRLLGEATGYGVYDARIMFEGEPESGDGTDRPVVDIKDAYLSMNELPQPLGRWRIGNFFVPFSLEQVTNDTQSVFLERSIPTQGIFAHDREVGMALYGINDAKDFTWSSGVFVDSLSESTKERVDDNMGQRVSERITWLPYYDEPSNGRYLVHTGMGAVYTHDQDGLLRFRARPQIHEGPFLIDSGNLAAGAYTTSNLEFAVVAGPFSVQSEAFLANVNMIGAESEWIGGAYIYCSYFLTGENRVYERYGQHGAQFGRVQPFSNFFWVPGCCGPGAWEIKGRWSNLSLNSIDTGEYNDFTFGFNWYWTERIRIMFDWIHPVTTPGTKPYGATTSDIIGMRFDYNF